MANMNAEELLAEAIKAKAELDAAKTKDEVATVFDGFKGTLGYKVTVRLLLGSSPEEATAKWRAKLSE